MTDHLFIYLSSQDSKYKFVLYFDMLMTRYSLIYLISQKYKCYYVDGGGVIHRVTGSGHLR